MLSFCWDVKGLVYNERLKLSETVAGEVYGRQLTHMKRAVQVTLNKY